VYRKLTKVYKIPRQKNTGVIFNFNNYQRIT
jgi:hypothetical protein